GAGRGVLAGVGLGWRVGGCGRPRGRARGRRGGPPVLIHPPPGCGCVRPSIRAEAMPAAAGGDTAVWSAATARVASDARFAARSPGEKRGAGRARTSLLLTTLNYALLRGVRIGRKLRHVARVVLNNQRRFQCLRELLEAVGRGERLRAIVV